MADNCDDCGTREIDFDCQWCSITRRCYDALDRYTDEFKNAGCGSRVSHNENMPMKYTEIFKFVKKKMNLFNRIYFIYFSYLCSKH